jgi:membrane associated rhomboid family serine protease
MLPLGLGLPLHRWPIITLLIAAACIYKYVTIDHDEMKLIKEEVTFKAIQLIHNKEFYNFSALEKEYCLQELNDPKECQELLPVEKSKTTDKNEGLEKALSEAQKGLVKSAFLKKITSDPNELAHLKSYSTIQNYIRDRDKLYLEIFQRHNLLSVKTQTINSYFNAIFTHSNYEHLSGNMFALLVFGIYVEARIGALMMLGCYLFAGFFSAFVHINISSPQNVFIVGASGCIAGIMGMFYSYFFNHYLRFWSLKTFLLPVKTYFPFFFILTDILMHITGGTNVATMAHLSGMFFGMTISYFGFCGKKVPDPFIYTEECDFYQKIKNRLLSPTDLKQSINWLRFNPMNFLIRERLVSTLWSHYHQGDLMSDKEFETLRINTRRLIGRSLHRLSGKAIIKTLATIPLEFSLSPFLDDFTQKELVKIYNFCLKKREPIQALRLACTLMENSKDNKFINQIIDNSQLHLLNEQDQQKAITIFSNCKNPEIKNHLLNLLPYNYQQRIA